MSDLLPDPKRILDDIKSTLDDLINSIAGTFERGVEDIASLGSSIARKPSELGDKVVDKAIEIMKDARSKIERLRP